MNKKQCQYCGSSDTVQLSSLNEVICCNCKRHTPWELKPGQPSVLEDKKVGGRDE